MAIVQISQIQVRRGLNQDLPQLASGELGWSLDSRQLYIGNGTKEEGAPIEGVTEVLTQHSNFFGFISSYTFAGTEAGYTSQTGASQLTPVTRSLQTVLDEEITVKDFGAVGDGVTDDTAAITRAIQEVYVSSLNGNHINVQRRLKFTAGTYKITSTLLIPPNCTIWGEGKNNSVISAVGVTPFISCDSLFQTGVTLGHNSAILPISIKITDLTIKTTSTTLPVVYLDTATDIIFDNVKFSGGNYSLSLNNSCAYVRTNDCIFSNYSVQPFIVSSATTGLVTRSNYYDTNKITLITGTTNVATLGTGAGVVQYQLDNGSNGFRVGQLSYSNNGSSVSFNDEYNEPTTSLGANVWANATGTLSFTVSTTTTLKYNIRQFI